MRLTAGPGPAAVLPLSAGIRFAPAGLASTLTPIQWMKVTNIRMEASRSRGPGKAQPTERVVKNDLEHVLLLRKPGGYRRPTPEQEVLSRISTDDYARWFAPVWTDVSGQLRRDHPAPFPLEVPRRLIRMFSFAGDVVLDPFAGTGTTALAALEAGRHSVSVEVEPGYVDLLEARIRAHPVAAGWQVIRRVGERPGAGYAVVSGR